MAKPKTTPTGASVEAYLASRASGEQLADCQAIIAICTRLTEESPHMWGPSIVGFGSYTYTYDTGHSGSAPLTGLAIRGREIVVYISADRPEQVERLGRLGRHRMGKSCLYIKRLADLDVKVLEALIADSVAGVKHQWPTSGEQ